MVGGNEGAERMTGKPEVEMGSVSPMFSLRRLAEFFDLRSRGGRPGTATVREWWHSGKLPPPDVRMSRKCVYWKPSTIRRFVDSGGARR